MEEDRDCCKDIWITDIVISDYACLCIVVIRDSFRVDVGSPGSGERGLRGWTSLYQKGMCSNTAIWTLIHYPEDEQRHIHKVAVISVILERSAGFEGSFFDHTNVSRWMANRLHVVGRQFVGAHVEYDRLRQVTGSECGSRTMHATLILFISL